jgi:hypothetical protein
MIKPKTPSGKTAALWLCLVLLYTLPLGPGLMAAENFTPRDKDEAWKWLKESLKHAGVTVDKVENNIVFARFDNKPLPINLEMTTSAALVTPAQSIGVSTGVEWYEFPKIKDSPGHVYWHSTFSNEAYRDQYRFQAALIFLAHLTQEEMEAKAAANLEEFKPKAAAWRQLAVKPEMPEEAHRHQVLAENAFQAKDVAKAIFEYVAALRAYSLWPEGHYNLAMLAGEIGGRPGYDIAIFHMKSYLELMPDAPDARAAKDSIIVWEDKR